MTFAPIAERFVHRPRPRATVSALPGAPARLRDAGFGSTAPGPEDRRTLANAIVSRRASLRGVSWDVLSDEQREIRELVRTLARERVAPRAAEIDASHEFPWDVVELFREHE